jgi:uncharacterized protein YndB with AHSA1/START domain
MTSRVLVALRVKATPERAFSAFVGDIGVWWRPNRLFQFTPRSPGVLSFQSPDEMGRGGRLIETLANGKEFVVGEIRVWEPPHRLVVGWRQASFAPDQNTEVQITFEPMEDGQTRVCVEHTGWERVPTEHVARHGFPLGVFLQRHGEWWRELLTAMSQGLS